MSATAVDDIFTLPRGQAALDPNSPPVWISVDQTLERNQSYSVDLDGYCSDNDLDPIFYSQVSGTRPPGMSLSGARSNLLDGIPTTIGTFAFTVRADDGTITVDQLITITITDTIAPAPPAAPVVTDIAATFALLTLPVSSAYDHANYRVLQSTNGVDFSVIEFGVTATNYVVHNLTPGQLYYWALQDVDNAGFGNVSATGAAVSSTTKAASEQWNINPIIPTGFLGNDTGLTNPNGQFSVTIVEDLGGTWEFGDGGYSKYTPHPTNNGVAIATYRLWDYDGDSSQNTAADNITVTVGT